MKTKDKLIAREWMRHRDSDGKVYELQAGERVSPDHPLVSLQPSLFLVASDKLVALEGMMSHDAEGNVREVRKGEALSPDDPFVAMHPTMVGPANYELEESA